MSWTVYILQCADKTLYTGVTNDLEKRMKAHHDGKGAKYTRGRGPFKLAHSETAKTRGEALKREIAIKSLGKAEKLALIKS